MRRYHALLVLWLHVVLMILASSKLSVLSWIWEDLSLTWEYFRYAHQSVQGPPFESDYTLPVVLTYVAAYLIGILGFSMSRSHVRGGPNGVAGILCLVGLASFAIEASHWLIDHGLSWIAICPAASLIMAGIVLFQFRSPTAAGVDRTRASDL